MNRALLLLLSFFIANRIYSQKPLFIEHPLPYTYLGENRWMDFDHDGDMDLLVTGTNLNYMYQSLDMYENVDGIIKRILLLDTLKILDFRMADIDMDGNQEFTLITSSRVYQYDKRTKGFDAVPKFNNYNKGSALRNAFFLDLDSNKNIDLVLADDSSTYQRVIVLLNYGSAQQQRLFIAKGSKGTSYSIRNGNINEQDKSKGANEIFLTTTILSQTSYKIYKYASGKFSNKSWKQDGFVGSLDFDNNGINEYLFNKNDSLYFLSPDLLSKKYLCKAKTKGIWIEDMNGDTLPDLVFIENNALKCVLNLDSFKADTVRIIAGVAAPFGTITDYQHFVFQDIDFDGDLDLFSFSVGQRIRAEYENKGNFRFEVVNVTDLNTYTIDKMKSPGINAIADIDNDGDLDLICPGLNSILLLENDGSENFKNRTIAMPGSNGLFYDICVTDFNKDGQLDIIGLSGQGKDMLIELQVKAGVFKTDSVHRLKTKSKFSVLRVMDFDKDSTFDILLNDGPLAIYLTRKDSFQKVIPPGGVYAYGVGDLDSDGDLDIIFGGNNLYWDQNKGSGTFTFITLYNGLMNSAGNPFELQGVIIEDIDGDKHNDIFLADKKGSVFFSNNNGVNPPLKGWRSFWARYDASGSSGGDFSGFCLIDFNRDGLKDMLFSQDGLDYTEAYKSGGLINFKFKKNQGYPSGTYYQNDIFKGDIDNDGDIDFCRFGRYGTSWYENTAFNTFSYLSTRVFWDKNTNGSLDTNEMVITGFGRIALNNEKVYSFRTDSTLVNVVKDTGDYKVELAGIDTSLYYYTNDRIKKIHIDTPGIKYSFDFGLNSRKIQSDLSSDLTSGWPRCGRVVPHWITLRNLALKNENADVIFKNDSLAEWVSSDPSPDTVTAEGYVYRVRDLGPFDTKTIRIELKLPIPTDSSINLKHLFFTRIPVPKDTPTVQRDTFIESKEVMSQQVRCSYDPNDKQSLTGYTDSGYISSDQAHIDYLVRFQNTGNDTAYHIKIIDNLPEYLDAGSLEILAFSHPLEGKLNTVKNQLTFNFKNIYLVDSATDQINSMGFVKFRLKIRKDLPKDNFERIRNRAFIYFDDNYPIITNTASNIFYYCKADTLLFDTLYSPTTMTGKITARYLDSIEWKVNGKRYASNVKEINYQLRDSGTFKFSVTFGNSVCGYQTHYREITNDCKIDSFVFDTVLSPYIISGKLKGKYIDSTVWKVNGKIAGTNTKQFSYIMKDTIPYKFEVTFGNSSCGYQTHYREITNHCKIDSFVFDTILSPYIISGKLKGKYIDSIVWKVNGKTAGTNTKQFSYLMKDTVPYKFEVTFGSSSCGYQTHYREIIHDCSVDSFIFDTLFSPYVMNGKLRGKYIDSVAWKVNGKIVSANTSDFTHIIKDTIPYKFEVSFGSHFCGYRTYYREVTHHCRLDSFILDTIVSSNIMSGKLRGKYIDSVAWKVNGKILSVNTSDFTYVLKDTILYKFEVTFGSAFCNYRTLTRSIKLDPGKNVAVPSPIFPNKALIFPNPTTGKLEITGDPRSLHIFNSLGQKVATYTMENRPQGLDLSYLPGGVYTLYIEFKDN